MVSNSENNKSFSVGCIEVTKRYAKKLGFDTIFNRFKSKGDKLSNLVAALVSHKLHFSKSINDASEWSNQPHIRNEFGLSENVPKTFYRVLETLGRHDKSILTLLQNRLSELYHFENTDADMDWSSLVLFGDKAKLGEFGYSRDHRPDKRQITFGVAQYRAPINIPFALSIQSGSVPDKVHFDQTFRRMLKALNPGSMIVVDRGANSKEVKQNIRAAGHHFLCPAQLSARVDPLISGFNKTVATIVEDRDGRKTYCHRYGEGDVHAYLYFSEKLHEDKMRSKRERVERELRDSRALEKRLLSRRKRKAKKLDLSSIIAEMRMSVQHRLRRISHDDLVNLIVAKRTSGREGFFLLKSTRNLTPKEALTHYRSRDSIEKLMDSLKNTIRIKPVRVWTNNAIEGALIIGFLAQLILALMRYEHETLRKIHPRTLLHSLRNLTLTLEDTGDFCRRRIISNLDQLNTLVFGITTRAT